MYKRILVAVDDSQFSHEIIPHALGIASQTGMKVELLRVIEDEAKKAEAESNVQSLASAFGMEYRVVGGQGNVAADILGEANRDPDTLIAITTHGHGGVVGTILGSVAREIVRSSHKPILVYRPMGKPADGAQIEITNILLPLDREPLSESMKPVAVAWARALNATLTVVQVLEAKATATPLLAHDIMDSSYVHSQASDISEEFGVETDFEVLHGDPIEAISEYIGGRKDVLAVIATRGRSGLQKALFGGVTSGLINKSGIPLIVQAPDKIP